MKSRTARHLPKSNEQILLDHLGSVENHDERGWILHIHVSRLGLESRAGKLNFALDAFAALIKQFRGKVFPLTNGDLVCAMHGHRMSQVRLGLRRIQLLLHDDPIFHMVQDGRLQLYTTYDLNCSFAPFRRLIEALAAGETISEADMPPAMAAALEPLEPPARRDAVPANDTTPPVPESGLPVEEAASLRDDTAPAGDNTAPECEAGARLRGLDIDELTLNQLGPAIRSLASDDLSRMVRTQPVCMMTADRLLVPVFQELYTSIHDLEQATRLALRLSANRWLFQHLTRILDRRMLGLLAGDDVAHPAVQELRARLLSVGNFSLNLNVASVLSRQFQAFDAAVANRIRGTLVLELHKVDVFADLGSYMYVRDFARRRGYRICLDGVSHLSLPFIDRADLDVDLMKIYWTHDMTDDEAQLRELICKAGPRQIILCRCDTGQSIDFGRAIGISLFQGKQVDDTVEDEARAPSYLWSFSTPAGPIKETPID
ncbi:MAG: hypothetical protein ACREE7_14910 [Dongiaceae bacterium]